ncbi:hypothetical protein AB7008_13180 [Bradyrhizobium sp. 521_C7_N1_3]|uniref:hypothetical protein n=1 Tax=Bradyrhizobium sp. 521_C7_N1_3 TaxID=3240368 RepID=UPI003F88E2E8
MKRFVVDKNMLEDSQDLGAKHPLRAWLAASKEHIVVVTDYAHLEMLKGNALKNILKSTEILAEFPKQVHIVKPITAVSALKGKEKGRKKRMTSGRGTKSFRRWCNRRWRAAVGDKRFERSILRNGERASMQFADMLENMKGFADNIKDATKEFTKKVGLARVGQELKLTLQRREVTSSVVVNVAPRMERGAAATPGDFGLTSRRPSAGLTGPNHPSGTST